MRRLAVKMPVCAFKFFFMDQIFLSKVYNFLQLSNPTDEQIINGARLLLQMNNNRGLYNSTLIRPQYYLKWVRADLQKMYAIRRRGLMNSDVAEYNDSVVKAVEETLSMAPDEETAEEEDAVVKVVGIRGKREDHDRLPEEIQNLWTKNAEQWKKMRQLHMQLALMIKEADYQPCDGNEMCYQLCQADNELRNNYNLYDSFCETEKAEEQQPAEKAAIDDVKTVQAARTLISRRTAKKNITDEDKEAIQEAVNVLVSMKVTMKPQTIEKLKALDIAIPYVEGAESE